MSLIRHRPPVATDGDRARSSAGRRRSGRTASPARRLVSGVLVAAAGTAALTIAGPFALRPFADVAGAAGDVTVAFVLDFGGSPSNVVSGCVSVPSTDNRYDALGAFTASRGLAVPVYAQSGLLCSINGTPGSGCGQTVPGGYVYWSYFTGGPGGWTYASSGASGTVTPNDVEGWRFQDPGSGRPNDPPPRSTAQYSAICPNVPPTTTTTAPTPTTPATAGPVIPAAHGGGGSTAGGSMTTGAATGAGSHPTTTSNSATTASTPSGTSGTGAPGSTVPTHPSNPVTSLSGTGAPTESAIGVASVARHAAPGSGPGPVIVGGLLVAGLAVAAWVRWRKRLGAS